MKEVEQREQQFRSLIQEIGQHRELSSQVKRKIESQNLKKEKIELDYQLLLKKLEQIQQEASSIEEAQMKNTQTFETHFKQNKSLWEVLKGDYVEGDLRTYVEEDLAESIKVKLAEFDKILTNTLATIKNVPLA